MSQNQNQNRDTQEKLIFEWQVPPDYKKSNPVEDIAQAYRVYLRPEVCCIIQAKYHDEWIWNPSNVRPLVKHLLDMIIDNQKEVSFLKSVNETLQEKLKDGRLF